MLSETYRKSYSGIEMDTNAIYLLNNHKRINESEVDKAFFINSSKIVEV